MDTAAIAQAAGLVISADNRMLLHNRIAGQLSSPFFSSPRRCDDPGVTSVLQRCCAELAWAGEAADHAAYLQRLIALADTWASGTEDPLTWSSRGAWALRVYNSSLIWEELARLAASRYA